VAAIQAIVLADNVYRDVRTGKHVVAGTFHQINVLEIPTTLPLPQLGRYTLRVIANGSNVGEAPVRVVMANGAAG
jgi:hypothetical protein